MQKTVVILRGVSGSGKSTLTKHFTDKEGWVSVSADYYFLGPHGTYDYDVDKLRAAHEWCGDEYKQQLRNPLVDGIVVDNTNTKPKEFQWYIDEAEKYGAMVISIVVENRHGNNSIHDVPQVIRDNQENRIRGSLKLQ